MKRTLLAISLCLVTSGFAFAQKSKVKSAKSAMNSEKYDEAKSLIKDALTDPETMNDPETWKTAGDIGYTAFEVEYKKEKVKEIMKDDGGNKPVMFSGLYEMYDPYIKADELAQQPDAKGKVKNKVRKNIINNFKDGHKEYLSGGFYYLENKDFKKATDFFVRYWDIPSLNMMKEEGKDLEFFGTVDSTFQIVKFYAVSIAMDTRNDELIVGLLNRIIDEGYVENSAYQEKDVYEILASQYNNMGDSVNFVKTLEIGSQKFPESTYLTPNLINSYIRAGKVKKALDYIDQAIENNPSNSCDLYNLKATLYREQKNMAKSEEIYKETLKNDPNCLKAKEGLAVIYILKSQEVKNKSTQKTNRAEQLEIDKEAIALYEKAYPILEELRITYRDTNTFKDNEINNVLNNLQLIYYNLDLLGVSKKAELDSVEKELEN